MDFLILLALLFISLQVKGQVTSSPYSRYGLGELNRGTFSQNFALGNTSIGLRNPGYINIGNPASYSAFDMTVFEAGLNSNFSNFSSDTTTFNTYQSSFAYLGFGLPIMPWWGMSFGLLPYSSVGYNILHTSQVENIGNVTESYQGAGGINRAYLGNGFKFWKISAGFNASYFFGTLTDERRVSFDTNIPFNTIAINETSVSDFSFDLGLQYKDSLFKKWIISLGAVYGLRTELNANRQEFIATYQSAPAGLQMRDTVLLESSNGKIVLPESFGAGFSLEYGRWMIAGDWKWGKWSDFRNFNQSDSLINNLEYTFGAQFTPDREAVADYWKLVQYRAGLRKRTSYLQLNNTPIMEYGITFGAGLPLRRTRTSVNVGFEIGQRGTKSAELVRERFINFNLGIAINDRWFIKRKYD